MTELTSLGVIRFDDAVLAPVLDVRLQHSQIVLSARVHVTEVNVMAVRAMYPGQMVMVYGEDGSFIGRTRTDKWNSSGDLSIICVGDTVAFELNLIIESKMIG